MLISSQSISYYRSSGAAVKHEMKETMVPLPNSLSYTREWTNNYWKRMAHEYMTEN